MRCFELLAQFIYSFSNNLDIICSSMFMQNIPIKIFCSHLLGELLYTLYCLQDMS